MILDTISSFRHLHWQFSKCEIMVETEQVEGLDDDEYDLGEYPIDSLLIRTEPRSVFETIRRIDSGNIIMDPDFQRDFVWEQERQSKLIESALMRIPLPVFYLAETGDGRIVVVDGLQRLTTFHRFLNGDFRLKGLEYAGMLNGNCFEELPPKLKNRLEDTSLTLYLIDSAVPDQAKFDIFERVNSGVPLTRQQMRNCLYVGEATRWLRKMAHDAHFLKVTAGSLDSNTMRDRECINRFAGFSLFGLSDYDGKLETFLNRTLKKMNELKSNDYAKLTESFQRGMTNCYQVFGRNAFRKMPRDSTRRTQINVTLFDVLSVLFAQMQEDKVATLKDQLLNAFYNLMNNPEFVDAISSATNQTRKVKTRFRLATEEFGKVIQCSKN